MQFLNPELEVFNVVYRYRSFELHVIVLIGHDNDINIKISKEMSIFIFTFMYVTEFLILENFDMSAIFVLYKGISVK